MKEISNPMVLLPHVQVLFQRASERQLLTQAQTATRYPSEYLIVYADTIKLLSLLIPPTHDSMLGNITVAEFY